MSETWVVFDSDWREPPGDVIATFATKSEAFTYCYDGPGKGFGWVVLLVPAPGWERPEGHGDAGA